MKLNLSIFGFVLLTGVVFFSVGCSSNGISNATPSLALATTIPAATHSSATRSVETAVPATPIAITATATNIAIPATVTVAVASPTLTPESTTVPVEPAGTPSLFFLAPDGHIYGTDEVGSFRQQLTIMPEPLDENSEVWRSFYYYRPPQLSPDGQWLILNDGRGGWSLLELSPQRIHSQGKGDPLLSPSWAPDSQRFVYVGQNNQQAHAALRAR